MKFKVMISIPGTAEDGGANFSFYTLSEAQSFAEQFRDIYNVPAYLWNGSTWVTYPVVP